MRLIDADALIKDMDGDLTDAVAERRALEKIDNAPTIGGWISVNDRLPENDKTVLVACRYGGERNLCVSTSELINGYWNSIWDLFGAVTVDKTVFYWMPLPEPPKEDEDD